MRANDSKQDEPSNTGDARGTDAEPIIAKRIDGDTDDPELHRLAQMARDALELALRDDDESIAVQRAREALRALCAVVQRTAPPSNPKHWRDQRNTGALRSAVIELERARAELGTQPIARTIDRIARAIVKRRAVRDDGLDRIDLAAWKRALRSWPGLESIKRGSAGRGLAPTADDVLHELLASAALTACRNGRELGKQRRKIFGA